MRSRLRGCTLGVILLAALTWAACGGEAGPSRVRPDTRGTLDLRAPVDVPPPDAADLATADVPLLPRECKAASDCDDAEECTADLCDAGGRCVHTAVDGSCDDGDPCTGPDACDGGACRAPALECGDDADPCTEPRCLAGVGCALVCRDSPACATECVGDAGCDDGDSESVDLCHVGPCASACTHFWPRCDDQNECTVDRPDERGDCVHVPLDGVGCDDGDPCTAGDACVRGACVGPALDCQDGSPCTIDTCEGELGCVSVPAPGGLDCDDGDACTVADTCGAGVCRGRPVTCEDDGDACSLEYCDPILGCRMECRTAATCAPECDVDGDCGDADPCTRDACEATACTRRCVHRVDPCDDGEFCTVDYCDPSVGSCAHAWWCIPCRPSEPPEVCDDGDACTTDRCQNDGFCVYSGVSCPDDGDSCSVERCDATLGCVSECSAPCERPCVTDGQCADANACTVDHCVDGPCGRHCTSVPMTCTALSPCTSTLCVGGTCISSIPVAAPTLDGDVGTDWHSRSQAGSEIDGSDWPDVTLDELRVQMDANLLYIGVRGRTALPHQAIVGFLDVDFGRGTGVDDLGELVDETGALDSALSNCGEITVAGFGADIGFGTVGMASAFGPAEVAGWRLLATGADLQWLSGGVVLASAAEGGMEAAIPLSSLPMAAIPAEGAVMALVVLVTEAGATCSFADQSLPDQPGGFRGAEPLVGAVFRFLVQPSHLDCCTAPEDCRDGDPCTRDLCTDGGSCRHQGVCSP